MKKVLSLVLVLTLWVIIYGPPAARGQEVVDLKWASPFPIGHIYHQVEVNFIDRIHKYTNHRVKIVHFPSEQLGKAKDMLYLCGQGVADISHVHVTYFAGQLPLNAVIALPFYTTAGEGTEIYVRLAAASPEIRQEYMKYGTRIITPLTTSQYDIGTLRKPVKRPEDLKGLKLKTPGGIHDRIAQKYGIIPVSISAAETYEALQRKIVEGVVFTYSATKAYRFNELLKYFTQGLRMGGYPTAIIMNEKKWNQMSGEIQQVFLQTSGEIEKQASSLYEQMDNEMAKQYEKEGMAIHRIQAKDRALWEEHLKGVEEVWIQEVEKKGLPGKKVFETFQKICQQVAK